jgi:hypothetical protein
MAVARPRSRSCCLSGCIGETPEHRDREVGDVRGDEGGVTKNGASHGPGPRRSSLGERGRRFPESPARCCYCSVALDIDRSSFGVSWSIHGGAFDELQPQDRVVLDLPLRRLLPGRRRRGKRPVTFEDILSVRAVAEPAVAPDGSTVLFTVSSRPPFGRFDDSGKMEW